MNIDFLAFDSLPHLGERASHPMIRLVVRQPFSFLVAGPGLPPRRFAAVARPNALSDASNCGFQDDSPSLVSMGG